MSDRTIQRLTGITWSHTRGYTPMIATAQRFAELHEEVEISWEKRSLQAFADEPIDVLAKRFDLLVIDHPWVGFAAKAGFLLPLDEHLPADFLADQAANSVGQSHASYTYGGHHWALAIDAATPVSAYRPDLLERFGCSMPKTWQDVIALGRRGLVACPGVPIDVYCNFLNVCVSSGANLFPDAERVVAREHGRIALELLKELASVVSPQFFRLNPIAMLEVMSQTDGYAYCPYTYGYSNYSRPGYAPKLVRFGDVVRIDPSQPGSTVLGGTGLAISSRGRNRDLALRYAQFVASSEIQRALYFQTGGQPGHRSAWLDDSVNAASSNYFRDTLPVLDRAFVRPRYPGFLDFQDHAGDPIHAWLREGGSADRVLDSLDELYRKHKQR